MRPQNLLDIKAIEKEQSLEALLRSLPKSTYHVVQDAAKHHPDKIAIAFLPDPALTFSIKITYQELLEKINQVANLFLSLGIAQGKTVSYLLPNIPENYYVLFAAEAVGIANPISPELSPAEIAEILFNAETELLVTAGAPSFLESVLAARDIYQALTGKHIKILVISSTFTYNPANQDRLDFQALLEDQPTTLHSNRVIKQTDQCAYFHSSGTTGKPKLAVLTHQNKLFMQWALMRCFDFNSDDVFLNGMPLFHVAGPSFSLLSFRHGATVVLMSPMGWKGVNVIENFWKIAAHYQGTVTAGLPFIYSAITQIAQSEQGIDLKKLSLRLAISGNALDLKTAQTLENLIPQIKVVGIYGSTETTAIASFTPPDAPIEKRTEVGAMGIGIPYTQIKINEAGAICISGPHVMAGYKKWGEKIAIKKIEFNSHDLGIQNSDGSFCITCRAVDLIQSKNSNGESIVISELALEQIILTHPAVDNVAVIGRPDVEREFVPVAYVQLKKEMTLSQFEIQAWMQTHILSASSIPFVVFEKELPCNGMGKVKKPLLREREIERVAIDIALTHEDVI